MQLSLSSESDQEFFELLDRARQGDQAALGRLIDRCRPYLLKIAHDEGDSTLQGKVGESDVVQFACLDAVRGFGQFRGRTSVEMFHWLRQIVIRRLHGMRDHYLADKRPVEVPFPADLVDSKNDTLEAPISSPSDHAMHCEEREVLEIALKALAEPDRMLIEMRQKEGLAFAEIGKQLHVTEEAARKRWARAIQSLQEKVRRLYGLSSG